LLKNIAALSSRPQLPSASDLHFLLRRQSVISREMGLWRALSGMSTPLRASD
jgi:hypothetical protein